jgi:preprotein translocase subunit YajC
MQSQELTGQLLALNESGGGEWMSMLLLMGGMGLIIYFVIIRPQSKERQKLEVFLTGLTKGDKVVTNQGMHGKITEVRADTVSLEVASKTTITFEKSSIARLAVVPQQSSETK